jgi:hypothetical protein
VVRAVAAAAERGKWALTDAERREAVEKLQTIMRTTRSNKVAIYAVRALALLDGLNVKREGHSVSAEVNAHADAARVLASMMQGQGAALLGTLAPPPLENATPDPTPDSRPTYETFLRCGGCQGEGCLTRERYAGTCDLCHGVCYLHGPARPL